MSNLKYAAGVILAGALAFGAVFAAQAVTTPLLHGASDSSHTIETDDHPTEEEGIKSQLIGRWKAPQPANQNAFVEFSEIGTWYASDGCNNTSGGWSVMADGSFDGALGGGMMTQIGCDNVAIPGAVWGASYVSVAGDELTLISDKGDEMVLQRASDEAFTIVGSWTHKGDNDSTVKFASDGTWTGKSGCSEFNGTWKLGIRDVPVLEDTSSAARQPVLLSSPSNLVIGPKPENPGTVCADGPKEFVLKYDEGYTFYNSEHEAFSLIPDSFEGDAEGTSELPILQFDRS